MLVFAISKRVGKAAVRNRLRRQLREIARRRLGLPGGVYLIQTRPAAATLNFTELSDHMARALASLAHTSPASGPSQ